MKLRKVAAGAAAVAAASALALSASASLLVVENAPSNLSSGSGMWMAKIYCPSEGIDFGVDYASIAKVQFQITTDDTDFFEGMFGGAVVMSCGPASQCPADHNWVSSSFWGCIDEELAIETMDTTAAIQAETLGDYTYQLTLNVDDTNCLYAPDVSDAYAQIAVQEWGQDMSQIVVKGMQAYDAAGNLIIAFDGEGNRVDGGAADETPAAEEEVAAPEETPVEEAPVEETPAEEAPVEEAPAVDIEEAPVVDVTPAAGDVDAATDSSKGSPDTGIADVAAVAGLAIVAGGAVVLSKKRK